MPDGRRQRPGVHLLLPRLDRFVGEGCSVVVLELSAARFGHLDCFIANTEFWDFGTSVEDLPSDERFDEAFDQLFALNVKPACWGESGDPPVARHARLHRDDRIEREPRFRWWAAVYRSEARGRGPSAPAGSTCKSASSRYRFLVLRCT